MHRLGLALTGLLLSSVPIWAQQKPETMVITLQGNGPCTTRSFVVQDNWHVESASDAPIKIDATPIDGSPSTTLVNSPAAIPPPPSYNAVSAPVVKGGTYSLAITATGTWQITMIENGFLKNLSVGGSPSGSSTTAVSGSSPSAFNPAGQPAQKHRVTTFHGSHDQNPTQSFSVSDNWEISWLLFGPTKITLVPADGSNPVVIVNLTADDIASMPHRPPAGVMMPIAHNSSIQTKGGAFTFQVEADQLWEISVNQLDSSSMQASVSTQPGSSDGTATVPTPAAPAAPAPIVKLTDDQTRAVVLIKGDNSEGTGFLVKMPDGPVVVTNIHVIANNPNLKITTSTGAVIPMISAKGASDRDLALLSIKDAGYSYLTICPDIGKTAQNGDEVVTPGNSLGGEVMLNTGGKVLGIGPQRIEIDNPIYHGNSGGPIFHTKSGQVLGVVTEGMKVDTSDALDHSSFTSRNSAISGSMRYFGMRLDNVPSWIPIDWDRFQGETYFLEQFHEQSRRLDSYLNTSDSDTSADAHLYRGDDKIMKANDTFRNNAETDGRVSAIKGLVFDLQGVADKGLDQIQIANNFYPFDQERARYDTEYRKALKRELDKIGDNAERFKNPGQQQ